MSEIHKHTQEQEEFRSINQDSTSLQEHEERQRRRELTGTFDGDKHGADISPRDHIYMSSPVRDTFMDRDEIEFMKSIPLEQKPEYENDPSLRRLAAAASKFSKILDGLAVKSSPTDTSDSTPDTREQ